MGIKRPKGKKRWLWLLLGVILASAVLLCSDNRPIAYRDSKRSEREVAEFLLANEDSFEYVISRLIETNYTGSYLQVGITKRTKDVVFGTDNLETRVSPNELGITVDDELIECLRVILVEGSFGRISIRRYPASGEYPLIFDVFFRNRTSSHELGIYYYASTERSPGAEQKTNINGNWYVG